MILSVLASFPETSGGLQPPNEEQRRFVNRRSLIGKEDAGPKAGVSEHASSS